MPADGYFLVSTPSHRLFSRIISLLIRSNKLGRSKCATLVLGFTLFLGWLYVATEGVVTLQVFYLIPIILAVSWLGLCWGFGLAIFSAALRFFGDYAIAGPDFHYFEFSHLLRIGSNRLSTLLVYLVVVIVVHELLILNRQLEERVNERTTALREAIASRERMQNSLFEAGLRERVAIGRDVHDGLGQHLTATLMASSILARRLEQRSDSLTVDARGVEALIKTGIAQSRQIARGLLLETVRPSEILSELEELAVEANQFYASICELKVEGQPERLDANMTSHLFYIAREALRNALRHGACSRVTIHLRIDLTLASLTICDNGRGIRSGDRAGGGMGLNIMSQRAEIIGGMLRVDALPDGGTRVDCRVPLAQRISK